MFHSLGKEFDMKDDNFPFHNYYLTFQPIHVTTNSLWDGIVLWELQEQKCQQRVCQPTDVVQTGQAGWMVLILQWKMMKFLGRSALAIVLQVANL